jgi:C4-dicarboxylate-specific signal transduction histidine kinase
MALACRVASTIRRRSASTSTKSLQILINLLRNAKHACEASGKPERQIVVRIAKRAGSLQIAVSDNGVGILPDHMTRIFSHGFTTKKYGHGFGLHSGALAARELGGALRVVSGGPGQGATFTLELPLGSPESVYGEPVFAETAYG